MKIENTRDLEAAIERLDKIWDDYSSPERCELIDAIVAYEDVHVYIEPPTVGDWLAFRADHLGLFDDWYWCETNA